MAPGDAARRLGRVWVRVLVALQVAYGVTLAYGLGTLPSPDEPIADPAFAILEILILLMMPPMVALFAVVHATARPQHRALGAVALAFMTLVAGFTSLLHFSLLLLARSAAFTKLPSAPLFLSFRWPSVPYAIDILAWDVFFPVSVLCAAPLFHAGRLERAIRATLVTSGVLALAGLGGAITGDMRVRNIGIVGYVPVFLVAVTLLERLFRASRSEPT